MPLGSPAIEDEELLSLREIAQTWLAAAAPIVSPEAELPLFPETAPPEPQQAEPRRSAFKKNEGSARKWKPLD